MFCAPVLIFGGTESVGSGFHILRSLTRFSRYRGQRVQFSYFALLNPLPAVPRAFNPVFMFCASRLVFDGTEGVGSSFHILCFWNYFRRFGGRQVQFSCFALPDSFSMVPTALGLVFMFCATGPVFSGFEGVGSSFHVLCSSDPFLAVRMASGPVFMFCLYILIFGGTERVRSRFHVLRSRTCFRR
jgi:hypothetical protein